MAALTLTKQDITDFVINNFDKLHQALFDMTKHYVVAEDSGFFLQGDEGISINLYNEDVYVSLNVSIDSMYELISNDNHFADAITGDIQSGNYEKLFIDLAKATLLCVSRKEEMTDDALLYEQGAYDEIEDYDKKFDSLIENVVNPFRQAVTAVVD